ncbi:MAG TPA: hypothetical protein VN686_04395 [Gaiellales bacterium]|jgi:hypothetical protein|nr:hypothetical protein [Gaiellales bacterium]
MWRNVLLGVVLAGMLAGCSRGGANVPLTAGTGPEGQVVSDRGVAGAAAGIVTGRVFTTACGGPAASSCSLRVYRGSLAFCSTMDEKRLCPTAKVDGSGHYTIRLRPGRHALIPDPGNGNVVYVKPRWVVVHSGQTTTVNINGGNLMS